ncbi:MFS transporter [Gryllotalpicola sp.]|uniref:MFS transporter n=1 Tax=Gryllotalpicola sp. TaxID=1932787 RepID=UPI002632257E|nr:MFS transporter [Gryllotalpicola sp.]
MFRSLAHSNYRIWFAGALVSNIGTWMQRTAQDWIVLTDLSGGSATSVGVTMALQFGPQLLLLPLTGYTADRVDKRKLLMITQAGMGVLGAVLAVLTLSHTVQLWHVYLLAFLLGCFAAFDAPARQTWVTSLVERDDLANAVGLNSASFQAARLIGPAVAGLLVAWVGAGWVFAINALSFAAVLVSLLRIREIVPDSARGRPRASGGLLGGFRYIARRRDFVIVLTVIFVIGTFGLNFPIYAATMSTEVFHAGAGVYGVLSSEMAIGSVAGALLAARREKPRLALLAAGCLAFGVFLGVAAVMPQYWLFGILLIAVGLVSQTIMTTANSYLQLTSDQEVRGRVMAIYLAVFMGGTPIGAPIVGWVADALGPRWGLGVGAASGVVGAAIAGAYLLRRSPTRSTSFRPATTPTREPPRS